MPRISFTTYEDSQKMPQWLQMQEALEPLPNRGNGTGEWERQQPTFPTKGVLKDLKPPWLQCDLKVHISTESSLEYSSPLPHDKILSVYGHSLKVCSDGIPEEGFRRFRSYKPLGTTQKTVFSSVLGDAQQPLQIRPRYLKANFVFLNQSSFPSGLHHTALSLGTSKSTFEFTKSRTHMDRGTKDMLPRTRYHNFSAHWTTYFLFY